MRFCPRIRSLHRQRIYCADPARDHGVLEPVLKRGRRAVNFSVIAEQSDRVGQFYAAFSAGCATASAAPVVEPAAVERAATCRHGSVARQGGRCRTAVPRSRAVIGPPSPGCCQVARRGGQPLEPPAPQPRGAGYRPNAAARPGQPEIVAGSQQSRVAPVALGPRSGRSLEGTGPPGAPIPTTSPAGVLGRPQMDDNQLEWLVRSRSRRSRGVSRWSTGAPRATGSDLLVSAATAGCRDFDPAPRRGSVRAVVGLLMPSRLVGIPRTLVPRVVVAVSLSNSQSHMRKRPIGVTLWR